MMMRKTITKALPLALALLGSSAALAQVNVKGKTVDATQGFTYQGTAPSGQTLCGDGSKMTPSASCPIAAATAAALAATPAQCAAGTVATGVNANGNANCSAVGTDYIWSFTSCSNNTGQPSRCVSSTTLPGNMPDANYSLTCTVADGDVSDQIIVIHNSSFPTAAGSVINYAMVQLMQNGTAGGQSFTVTCHAHHN